MAEDQAAFESMAQFVRRRQRELENVGQAAEGAARDAYGKAVRAGEDLDLPTPGDVTRYGARLLAQDPQRFTGTSATSGFGGAPDTFVLRTSSSPVSATGDAGAGQARIWLDQSPVAKSIVGDLARTAGAVPGMARGAWHTARDIAGALEFGSRLFDPYDPEDSPHGEAAWDKVINAGKGVFDNAKSAASDPMAVVNDIGARLQQFEVATDPAASAPAPTLAGEAARNFGIGLNQGEAVFDLGSLAYGGAEAKAASGIGKLTEAQQAAKYLNRGYPAGISNYFAEPYFGGGHHYLPRRTELPARLGGGPVPSAISDSPFFLLRPRGLSNGEFFERHVNVDPYYRGGKVPARHGGGGWSGKALGWQKYGRAGRVVHGSPTALRAVVGAGIVGAGAAVDQAWHRGGPR